MHYAALGDSISIDDYTGRAGGGAASQLARLLPATRFQDLTRDGNVAQGVLRDLDRLDGSPDVASLTVGGNNLLLGEEPETTLPLIETAVRRLKARAGRIILSTVYDPTDGDDTLGESVGLARELRRRHQFLNAGIRRMAARHECLLADLEELFRGHGLQSAEPWYVLVIEPNLAGATAIAALWHRLLQE